MQKRLLFGVEPDDFYDLSRVNCSLEFSMDSQEHFSNVYLCSVLRKLKERILLQ